MSDDLTKKLPSSNSEKILQQIDSRLQSLEQKVEERLYDTRPIWQKVVADIAQLQQGQVQLQQGQVQLQQGQVQLQEGQTRLEGDVREMRGEVHEIKVSIRDIYYKMDVLNETMLNVQAKHRDVDRRVRELESPPPKPTDSQT